MSLNKGVFEENLKELKQTVKKLEEGNVSLDEMLSLFENGIRLTKSCTAQLDDAEQKINILLKSENGELSEAEFEGLKEQI